MKGYLLQSRMKNCTPVYICGTRCFCEREMGARAGAVAADQTDRDFMNAKCSQQFANLSAGTYVFAAAVSLYMQKRRKPTQLMTLCAPNNIHTRPSLISLPRVGPDKVAAAFLRLPMLHITQTAELFSRKKNHRSSCYLAHWQSLLYRWL